MPARPESMLRSLETPHAPDMPGREGRKSDDLNGWFEPSNDSSVSADGADRASPKPLLSVLLHRIAVQDYENRADSPCLRAVSTLPVPCNGQSSSQIAVDRSFGPLCAGKPEVSL